MPHMAIPWIFGTNFIDSFLAINGLKVVSHNIPYLLEGAVLTLEITTLSVFFGLVLGLILALLKISGNRPMFYFSTAYIDFFRGTPLFVQILLLYFGVLPLIMNTEPFSAAVIACSLNCGAYTAEIIRAGIQAVDRGQMEAARSLGMNRRQAMQYVILPQAFKIVIPPLLNEFIAVLKDTSLVAVISAEELTLRGKLLYSTYFEAAWIWGAVAIIYFIMTKTLAMVGDYLERRMATE